MYVLVDAGPDRTDTWEHTAILTLSGWRMAGLAEPQLFESEFEALQHKVDPFDYAISFEEYELKEMERQLIRGR